MHRQKNDSKKCCRFFVGLPSPRLRGLLFRFGSKKGRQGALQLRAPTKNSDGKTPSDNFMSACPQTRCAVYFWAWFVDGQARSRLIVGLSTGARRGPIWAWFVDGQARRNLIIGCSPIRLRGRIFAWFVCGNTAIANAPRHRACVSSQKMMFHHKFVSVWIKRVFVFECKANANNFDNFADIACVWARNMLK